MESIEHVAKEFEALSARITALRTSLSKFKVEKKTDTYYDNGGIGPRYFVGEEFAKQTVYMSERGRETSG